ncbi:MAG TPA: hypothetical protein VFQ30_18285 [Ktedonobacteraceae bacterium]|nr:hypothetical protein [Ktedonobacteraceae bacterium]
MSQEKAARSARLISILGTVKGNENDSFLGRLNRFHLLMVADRDGRVVVNIPAWPLVAALTALVAFKRIGSSE